MKQNAVFPRKLSTEDLIERANESFQCIKRVQKCPSKSEVMLLISELIVVYTGMRKNLVNE